MSDLAQRYSRGGDIYSANVETYGIAGAERIAAAYLTGGRNAVGEAVKALKLGPNPPSTSTLALFAKQITTDPLAVPLESANRQLGNVLGGLVKNPLVLVSLAVVLFFTFGGGDYLRRRMANAK